MIDGIPNRPLYFYQKNIIYYWERSADLFLLVFDPYIRLFYFGRAHRLDVPVHEDKPIADQTDDSVKQDSLNLEHAADFI